MTASTETVLDAFIRLISEKGFVEVALRDGPPSPLFAQMRDGAGRLMDLGTKGSGQTPYSRFGDGRLTLERELPQNFDVLVLDAFSSDAMPTHSTASPIAPSNPGG